MPESTAPPSSAASPTPEPERLSTYVKKCITKPAHLADLRKSGLTDATIEEAGIKSIFDPFLEKYLPEQLVKKVASAYLIPYLGTDDFWRARLFPEIEIDGHKRKYHQPPGSPARLYIPRRARDMLLDATKTLYVCEGEKKALACEQFTEFPAVAVGGLWNWLTDKRPISDLNLIQWVGRTVRIIPDSDAWMRSDLKCAVYALGRELQSKGAHVEAVPLPTPPGWKGGKAGLDDYLVAWDKQPKTKRRITI